MTYIRVVSITIIWLLFSSASIADEQQRRAIIETVNQFFLAIETKDAELLESILIPGSLNIASRNHDSFNPMSLGETRRNRGIEAGSPAVETE